MGQARLGRGVMATKPVDPSRAPAPVAINHRPNDMGGHVRRVLVAQSAAAFADRCANRINNISLSHPNNLT